MAAPCVLIVDDNKMMQEMLVKIFMLEGMETRTATNGERALQILRQERPDIVILDLNLAGHMNGTDVLRTIRGDAQIARTPVIMLTFENLADDSPQAKGADLLMLKPVDPDMLVRLVERLLQKGSPT